MTQEELRKDIDEILDRVENHDGWMAIDAIMRLVNQYVDHVIGEYIPHSDKMEFIDPFTGISSRDRVKIWNECKYDMQKRAGL